MRIEQEDIDKIKDPLLKESLRENMESMNKLKSMQTKKGEYLGEKENNLPHGVGKLVSTDGNLIQIGTWDTGEFIGAGSYEVVLRVEDPSRFHVSNNTITTIGLNKQDSDFVELTVRYEAIFDKNGPVNGTMSVNGIEIYDGKFLNYGPSEGYAAYKIFNQMGSFYGIFENNYIDFKDGRIDFIFADGLLILNEKLIFQGAFLDRVPNKGKLFYKDLEEVASFDGKVSVEKYIQSGELSLNKINFGEGKGFDREGNLCYKGTYYGNNEMYNGIAYSPTGEEICTYKNGVKGLTKEEQKRIDLEADRVAEELLKEEQPPTKKKKEKKDKSSHQPFVEKTNDPKYLINQLKFGSNQNEEDLNSVSNVTHLTDLSKATQYTQRPTTERFEGADQNLKKQVLKELSEKLNKKITKKDIKTFEPSEMMALNKTLSLAIARREGKEIPKYGIKFYTTVGLQCEGYLEKLVTLFEYIDTTKPYDKSKDSKGIKDTIYEISESWQSLEYKFEEILALIKKHFDINKNNRLASKFPLKIIGGGAKLKVEALIKEVIVHDMVIVKPKKGVNYKTYYSNALNQINEFSIDEVDENEKEIFNFKDLLSSRNGGEYNAEALAPTGFNEAVSMLSCGMESRIKAAITDYLSHLQIKHEQETTTAEACFDSLITLMQPCFFSRNVIPKDKSKEEQRITNEIKKISKSDAPIQSKKEKILNYLQGAVDSATKQKISRKLNKYSRLINKEKEKRELQLSNTLGNKVDELIVSTTDKLAPKETVNSNEEETFKQLSAFQEEIFTNVSELEYQDNEILELLDSYLQENAITYYQPKRISINSFHKIQEIGYAIKFLSKNENVIANFSKKMNEIGIKNENGLTLKIDGFVNTIKTISLDKQKLQSQLKLFFSGIEYTKLGAINARLTSFNDYFEYNDNLNDSGELSSFDLKKSRKINEKIFTKNGITFVTINPGPIGLNISGQYFSDFDDKLKNALWELNNYLEENPSQKNSSIEFLFPLNINNAHWVLGRATINKNNKLVFKFHDPVGSGKTIQDSLIFQNEISNGISAYEKAFGESGTNNNLAAVTIAFDPSNDKDKNVQKGLYCGGAVLRMMLGLVLNKGEAYNWAGLDKNGRSKIDTNYLNSKQARLNDLAILKKFVDEDSEKRIVYTQLLERYRLNNNLVNQKMTKFENY
jgi:hypothetical protein